jgi:hypothetical protein
MLTIFIGGCQKCVRAVANCRGALPNRVAAVARRAPDHHAEVLASSVGGKPDIQSS